METEKSTMNKGLIGLIVVALIIGGYFYFSKDQKSFTGGKQATTPSFTDYEQPLSEDIINCEFKVISHFFYENKDEVSNTDKKVYYETTEESKPSLITFAGLSTKQPKMKGNLGDTPLTMIKNDTESIVLAEQNAFGEMFVYTIFKQERVATWYKAYKLVATPYGMISMGYCY